MTSYSNSIWKHEVKEVSMIFFQAVVAFCDSTAIRSERLDDIYIILMIRKRVLNNLSLNNLFSLVIIFESFNCHPIIFSSTDGIEDYNTPDRDSNRLDN